MALIETSVSAGRVSADQLVDRKTGEAIAVADIVNSSSGDTTVTSEDITDATEIGKDVLTAATQAAARTAIGAGTSDLVIGTTSGTAKAGDYKPVVSDLTDSSAAGRTALKAAVVAAGADQTAARNAIGAGTSNLAIGTTATTAMAGNKTPTTTQRGGVLQQPAIPDLTSDPTMADYNALLAALRAAGILAAS